MDEKIDVRGLFSVGSVIPGFLVKKLERVCSIIEEVSNHNLTRNEHATLWSELEDLLGVDVEVYQEEIRDDETDELIDRYPVYSVDLRPESLFSHLCRCLPWLSTVDWHDGKDYLILPNGFVLELYGAGLTFSKNIDSISGQIIREKQREEEYRKQCEEDEENWAECSEE